jgi:multiple sugar transport system ATP-binding protein
MTLGDRVVVMKDGVVLQSAPPLEIYERPVNRFVAGFIGTPPMSFIDGRVTRSNGTTSFEDDSVKVPLDRRLTEAAADHAGRPMVLGLRPDAFSLEAIPAAAPMGVRITLVETLGDRKDVYMTTRSGRPVIGRVDSRVDVREGQEREMHVDLSRVHLFEPGELGLNVTAAREASVSAN